MASKRSSLRWVGIGGGIVLTVVALVMVVDWIFAPPTLFRWKESDSTIRVWVDSHIDKPSGICFTITHGDQRIVESRLIAGYSQRKYQFEVASINNGNLVCVYETELAQKHGCWLIIVDFEKGECWPPSSYSGLTPAYYESWKRRYLLMGEQHRRLPDVAHFDRLEPVESPF
ncbi:MAG: hypothetical protein FJ304_09750 [Planctomycetes bacterium]|nr:hypothetical protein [Planctomycetota bacterium]